MLSSMFSMRLLLIKIEILIINIRVYSAVNKVRIPVEDWSTLRSNISVIHGEDLEGPISSYSQGHPQRNECKTRGPRATGRSPEWHSECRYANVM